ncbi:hypothetical protein [Streptomyces abikoensis]|uniref:hypothetical protein n=1 Tax=Streptomyces abikoensis TaxID=97398 RepID=UPI00167BDE96|nr:hypothetical protein [Streptomyces abikoensis]
MSRPARVRVPVPAVRWAGNYAGMPAVLVEVNAVGRAKAVGPGGVGFRLRNFGGAASSWA